MSKSILVIDTPENCIGCPCHFSEDTGRAWCGKENREILSHDIEEFKPDWCTLKDVPEKKPKVEYHGNGCFGINEAMQHSYNTGFNACIDEILKGVNGK